MDVEKTMQFILDAQARLFAGFDEMKAQNDEMKAQNKEFAAQQKAASERMDRLEAQAETDRQHVNSALLNLGRAMLGLTGHVERIDASLSRFIESTGEMMRHTDERINALVHVVDDLVRRSPAPPPAQ